MESFNVASIVVMPLEPSSKKSLQVLINDYIGNIVEEGNYDAVEIYAKLKYALEICTIALGSEKLKREVVDQVEMNNGEASFRGSVKISKAELGAKYDFSRDEEWKKCNDLTQFAKSGFDSAKDKQKDREGLLKAIAKSGKSEQISEDSGEIIYAPKLMKGGATSIKVTF